MHCAFSPIHFIWCVWCITTFVLILITVNNTCYTHVVYDSVVSFVISIDLWGITISILRGCDELINKKVSKIFYVSQDAVLLDSHESVWIFVVVKCFLQWANHYDWGYFGCSRKYPDSSSIYTNYNDSGSETLDGSYII